MIVTIEFDDTAALSSLYNQLSRNQDIWDADLSLQPTDADTQGATAEIIQLTVSTAAQLANLVKIFLEWRNPSQTKGGAVVQSGGIRTTLSPDKMTDGNVVRRALSGMPDPKRSSCILIGVSRYENLPQLPAAQRNLAQLKAVLADPAIWGVPSENLHLIHNPQSADIILNKITAAAKSSTDALLVYYAGHGLSDENGRLLLALPSSSETSRDVTVAWDRVDAAIRRSDSARQIVLLDCCYAGLALEDSGSSPELLEAAAPARIYMIAAAQKNAAAWSPAGQVCTAFTGELVHALRNGIPPGPPQQEFLSLDTIYHEIRRLTSRKHHPQPQRHDPDDIGQLPNFYNLAPEKKIRIGQPRGGNSGTHSGAPDLPYKKVLTTAAVVILAAFLVLWLLGIFSEKNTSQKYIRLGGISLTAYCSTLNPNSMPSGAGQCAFRVNLNAACKWQYHRSDLHHQMPANNLYDAKCYTKTGQQVGGGITNMDGYCKSMTEPKNANNATATIHNAYYKNEWACQIPVNMTVACEFEYKKDNLVARLDNSGNWACYEVISAK